MLHLFHSSYLHLCAILWLGVLFLCLASSPGLSLSFGDFTLKDWAESKPELKSLYVNVIMEQAVVHKVRFNKPAEFYQQELEKLARFGQTSHHAQVLDAPVAQSLATVAVVNCDWDNGIPPYEFALKYIGKEQLELLKNLYADAITTLQNNCQ